MATAGRRRGPVRRRTNGNAEPASLRTGGTTSDDLRCPSVLSTKVSTMVLRVSFRPYFQASR